MWKFLDRDGSCADHLSCYMAGVVDGKHNADYCVPNGQEYACCPDGIECSSGFSCYGSPPNTGQVNTCNSKAGGSGEYHLPYYAQQGSCNVNTGEPATELVGGPY